jgi:hypothetical protein
MKARNLTIPELMLIAGTRVALGIGIGLLIAGKFSSHTRKSLGAALLSAGALSTVPIAAGVLAKPQLTQAI